MATRKAQLPQIPFADMTQAERKRMLSAKTRREREDIRRDIWAKVKTRPADALNPKVYLSMDKSGFRVIQQGIPISNDKSTPEEALRAADAFHLEVSPWIWDGDAGHWVSSK